jgi:5'-nucleotidase (lipoprotein e(P4) family)
MQGQGGAVIGLRVLGVCAALACAGLSAPALAQGEGKVSTDTLNALLWVQSSAEYKAACLGTYAAARAALDRALDNPDLSAALEQEAHPRGKPPAVVLDLDDTVFDNSPYFAWLLKSGQEYSAQSFGDYVEERGAEPVPGAISYIRYAQSKGVAVFFVSNRSVKLEEATRDALKAFGVALDANGEDSVLLKRERRDWGMLKGSRRAFIAERYRIVQIVGDNLGDFVDDFGVTIALRAQEALNQTNYWGEKWMMLPNPVYGSWENAAYEYNIKLDEDERHAEKLRALSPWK